ncbi:GHMP kinases putative ATP-binding protein [Trichomonas vaginalis G3]|uniref:GHMP kinases putative ATP-binding protein n=1 Tax=Trichomonas vaginalis (strain ATCC PRA-98 / G3) TaxID=412133 RepID=A2F5T5_TRIV3|nr:GHMP kinases putative ATP-binding protein [Trichomonas vaginalis G3]|eukprot:XP_001312650.1 GHMP kinases ATP-binding protein [Trichomonas vaginalis G3]
MICHDFFGNVPLASGLSSSAALLCAIAMGLDLMTGGGADKGKLVESCVEAEHRVGVMCGGMDQAISILGEKDHACVISFVPKIAARPVKLPPAHFVVAHSGVAAAKLATADDCYNRRVEEVRRAAELMMPGAKTIGDVVSKYGWEGAMDLAKKLPEREGKLVLRDRAVHVVGEAHRVLKMDGASLVSMAKSCTEALRASVHHLTLNIYKTINIYFYNTNDNTNLTLNIYKAANHFTSLTFSQTTSLM